MHDLKTHGRTVLERVRDRPGGPELLDLAADRDDVELVGGAVRDLLIGRTPRELDVVLADDAPSFARRLASSLGLPQQEDCGELSGITAHERFGTALLWWPDGRVDIARRRAESYPAPGALPDIREGTAEEDLRRRDFTVNAIAVQLGGRRRGEARAAPGALEDLAAARLRVLHERSFEDDPTRLLRLARYRARLRFEPEEHTAELAAGALAAGALATLSGARIGMELRLALREPDALAALAAISDLGVLSALDPRLRFNERLARDALATLPEDGRADLLLLATLLLSMTQSPSEDPERGMFVLLDRLEFPAADRDRVVRTALLAPALLARLDAAQTASDLDEAVRTATLEAVALAASLGEERGLAGPARNARRWLSQLRHVRLQINGDDLLAAGIPAGPEIGRRLELALRRKLDGELAGDREAELRAALEGS
jgi:tRNA nucleotidyltransferase (CCA-adding enzyme)